MMSACFSAPPLLRSATRRLADGGCRSVGVATGAPKPRTRLRLQTAERLLPCSAAAASAPLPPPPPPPRGSLFSGPAVEEEEPVAERFCAEVVYALLAAHSAGVPPSAVLPKFHDSLTPKAYTSVLVALGRKERWDTAAAVATWSRQQGTQLPADSFVRVSQRRAEEGHWDRAVEAMAWMQELGCTLSGETVEYVAQLASLGAPHFRDRERLRRLVAWVRTTDAGRALWRVYAPDADAGPPSDAPAWRSQGLVTEQGAGIMGAPLDVLRAAVQEVVQGSGLEHAAGAGRRPDAKDTPPPPPPPPPPAAAAKRPVSDIDALVRRRKGG